MGTSQDNLSSIYGGNTNGATTFFYYTDNSVLTDNDIFSYGYNYYNMSGMYGIGEYLDYAGYDAQVLFNQYIAGHNGKPAGFTYEQYKAEIDADRPVLIHVEGHSMIGYGYLDGTSTIKVFDTWAPNGQNPGTMSWAGIYPHGASYLEHYAVTVMQPIPEPTTIILFSIGSLIFFTKKRRLK